MGKFEVGQSVLVTGGEFASSIATIGVKKQDDQGIWQYGLLGTPTMPDQLYGVFEDDIESAPEMTPPIVTGQQPTNGTLPVANDISAQLRAVAESAEAIEHSNLNVMQQIYDRLAKIEEVVQVKEIRVIIDDQRVEKTLKIIEDLVSKIESIQPEPVEEESTEDGNEDGNEDE